MSEVNGKKVTPPLAKTDTGSAAPAPDDRPRKTRAYPTMADIAARTNVHPTTVSLALRSHPSIPACTRKRILAAAA
ncbi:MAG: LacI family DNA-binding transcriptional regulator [Candidatus Synoicihabitans palmerolidicus]|nr:LacI family DNA-binding transcriptional regulator [Candidatus Synoicihabitans palmerolidicus]